MIDALVSAVVEAAVRPVREATAFGGGNGVLDRARNCSVQGIPLTQHST